MRRLLLVLAAVTSACTPEITSGAYICGPDSTCPEDLVCNGPDNLCVLPAQVQPFACEPNQSPEIDFGTVECVSAAYETAGCMMANDGIHKVTFVAPTTCAAGVEMQARVSFPVAFAEVGLELWDVAASTRVATSGECTTGADTGEARGCLDHVLTAGTQYRIEVLLTGNGTCDGACDYNRYTLRVPFGTPD